ncbi:MAG: hypothetical protein ACLTDF_02525 [Coprococcus sp.]
MSWNVVHGCGCVGQHRDIQEAQASSNIGSGKKKIYSFMVDVDGVTYEQDLFEKDINEALHICLTIESYEIVVKNVTW